MKKEIITNISLGLNKVRLDYFKNSLFEAQEFKGNGNFEQSCYVYLEKNNPIHMAYYKEIMNFSKNYIESNVGELSNEHIRFLTDGDKEIIKLNKKAENEGKKPYPNEHLKNCYRLKLKHKKSEFKTSPKFEYKISGETREIPKDDLLKILYRGCYAHVSVSFFGYYNKDVGSYGITTDLRGVRFACDGEKLGRSEVDLDKEFEGFETYSFSDENLLNTFEPQGKNLF